MVGWRVKKGGKECVLGNWNVDAAAAEEGEWGT